MLNYPKRVAYLLVLSLFLFSCQSSRTTAEPKPFITEHLIPNVQDETAPQYYALEDRLNVHDVPGFGISLLEDGAITYNKGFGFAQGDSIKVHGETIFHAGSISKSITALTALLLEQQGKLSLDTNISVYLKEWEVPESPFLVQNPITLRHLLNHKAGINNFNGKGFASGDTLPDLVSYLNGASIAPAVQIDTIPGVRYRYSNIGFGIVQLVLEDITGETLASLAQHLIFEPLAMDNSSFETIPLEAISTQHSFAHNYNGEVYDGYWRKEMNHASGGLKTTAKDLALLLEALFDTYSGEEDAYFSRSIVEKITSGQDYHLGFELRDSGDSFSLTHTGRVPGFFAYMRLYPATGDGFVLLANGDSGGEVFREVLRGLSDLNGWDIMQPRIIRPIVVAPEEVAQYLGKYFLTYEGEEYMLEVLDKQGHLVLRFDEETAEYPLRAIAKHQFVDIIDGDDIVFMVEDDQAIKVTTNDEYEYVRKE
ncbi:MAG: serine hydrolase domain-containing protein [Bacteroidota bacterium]